MNAMEGEPDHPERIMEYQRREFVLLSKMSQRWREIRKLRQQANEAVHSFEDTQKDSLQGAFVDPLVNLELAMLRQRLKDKDQEIDRLKEQSLSAAFHPNSIQGQKLLKKCAELLEENSDLARQLGEEWMQVLRIQLSSERAKRVQLRQRIAEFDRRAHQIDAENEQMQKRISTLGQQLCDTRAEIDMMKKDIEETKAGVKRRRESGAAGGGESKRSRGAEKAEAAAAPAQALAAAAAAAPAVKGVVPAAPVPASA